jgi:hypothetical protein
LVVIFFRLRFSSLIPKQWWWYANYGLH